MAIPAQLNEILELFHSAEDPTFRADLLIDFAARFSSADADLAVRPFLKEQQVPGCESEVYIFPKLLPDQTIDFQFAVENPQGVSAKGLAVILRNSLRHVPLEEVAALDSELVYTVFGRGLSMGKGRGLMGMVNMVKSIAREHLRHAKEMEL